MAKEGYQKAGDLVKAKLGCFDGVSVRERMLESLENDLKEAILPMEDLQKRSRELKGGGCPKCNKPWEKIPVNGRLMIKPFVYYMADCSCEATEADVKSKERLVVSRLRQAGVKGAYLQTSFNDWDNTVEGILTTRMSEVRKHFFSGYLKDGIGLILTGKVGTGKTFCAVGILRLAAKYTDSLLFVSMAEYIPMILDKESGHKTIETMKTVRLIVFDDIEKVASSNEWVKGRIFEIIEARTSSSLPSIITSNANLPQEFENVFGAPFASRVYGYCLPIHFDGKDYRKIRRMRQDEMDKANERENMKQGELL